MSWQEHVYPEGRETVKQARREKMLASLRLMEPITPMESVRPPECTDLERTYCPDRFWSQRFQMFVCRGSQCKPRPEDLPEPWTPREEHRLLMNSHLSLATLCRLLGRDRDDVRAKLREVDP